MVDYHQGFPTAVFMLHYILFSSLRFLYLFCLFCFYSDFIYTFYLQDFVAKDNSYSNYKSEMMDHSPENGGLSPRFSDLRFRSPPHLSTGPATPSPSTHSVLGQQHNNNEFEQQFLRVLQKVHRTIERNEIRLAERDRRDIIKMEWQHVALVVDRIFLVLFIGATLSVTFGIMLSAPHSRNNWTGKDVGENG